VNKLPQEVSTLYLDGVDPGEDDFQELSNLLFGAKERYRSARHDNAHSRWGGGRGVQAALRGLAL
jgi:hypothetical protein